MSKIEVIAVKVGQEAQIEEIENDLECFQSFVGGYVGTDDLTEDLLLWCNEEGMINKLPLNRGVEYDFKSISWIHGDFFITRFNEEGDATSVTQEDLEVLKEHLKHPV